MGFYYDRNGTPVSGILADMAYERGALSFASKMRYEDDLASVIKEEKYIKSLLKDIEFKPVKIEVVEIDIDSPFGNSKKIKFKNSWEI